MNLDKVLDFFDENQRAWFGRADIARIVAEALLELRNSRWEERELAALGFLFGCAANRLISIHGVKEFINEMETSNENTTTSTDDTNTDDS